MLKGVILGKSSIRWWTYSIKYAVLTHQTKSIYLITNDLTGFNNVIEIRY